MALLILPALAACSAEAGKEDQARAPVRVDVALPDRPAGPVLDQAGILPDDAEAALDRRLRRLWAENGDALVLVTISSLEEQSIEDYAFTLFNDWRIGAANTDRGLLILIAPNERKVRIEVGCGLESTISNRMAAQVIEQQMIPEFRKGNYSRGANAAADVLIARLALPKPANDPGPHSELCGAEAKEAA